MGTSEQNGIIREFGGDGTARWATFSKNGWQYCKIIQWADFENSTMARCRVSWTESLPRGSNINEADFLAEALKQAINLARRWERDTGKPSGEVLFND